MGRTYAGILGPLAFAAMLLRGVAGSSGCEATLVSASLSLAGFAVLGGVVGSLAEWIVEDSVRAKVAKELAAAGADAA